MEKYLLYWRLYFVKYFYFRKVFGYMKFFFINIENVKRKENIFCYEDFKMFDLFQEVKILKDKVILKVGSSEMNLLQCVFIIY